ncbi:MAG: hypothetical protein P8Z79_09035 [Sedimentisphaerales bacterium]|jgi:hypothetical protein
MRAIASILVLVGLTAGGCAGPQYYWFNPGKSLSEARQDCRECYARAVKEASEDVAEQYYRSRDMSLSPGGETVPWSTHSEHSPGPDLDALSESELWGSTHRENLFRGCMDARGYQLTREDDLGREIRKSSLRIGRVAGE